MLLLSKGVASSWPLFLLLFNLDPPPVVLDLKSFSIRLIHSLFIPGCSLMYLFSYNDIFCINVYDFIAPAYLSCPTEYCFFIMTNWCAFGRAASTYMIISNEWSLIGFLLNLDFVFHGRLVFVFMFLFDACMNPVVQSKYLFFSQMILCMTFIKLCLLHVFILPWMYYDF